MQRTLFDDGWRVRPKASPFLEILGGQNAPWEDVRLPHDAMIGGARDATGRATNAYFPGGVWEYEKIFVAAEELRGKRVLLDFEGVYRGSAVWVNGAFVGHRPYGYSEFAVSIGEHLHFGAENVVKVHASSHDDARWYSGAGIYRPVHLVVGEPVHLALDGVQVETRDVSDDAAVVVVTTVVENESLTTARTTVTTEVIDADGTVVGRDVAPLTMFAGRSETLRQRIVIENPQRWNDVAPNLYTCRTTVECDGTTIDEASTTFGIRTIEVDAVRGLRINGEPVQLRGACIHHDNGVIGAATIAQAEERRVEILKRAGFNALRSAHHPMSRAMLDACDRLGMFVMDEAFDMWTESKSDHDYGHNFPDWWPADVEAMVRKDRNHPCVIMYSIGNEIPEAGRPSGASIGRAITEKIRALDDTRLVTNSVNLMLACGTDLFASLADMASAPAAPTEDTGINTAMTELEDFMPLLMQSAMVDERTAESFAFLDVAGYNYCESRYALDHDLHPQRVIVGSETMPGALAANWELVRTLPHVIGDFTWTGWDYLGEVGIGRVKYGEGDNADESDAETAGLLGTYPWLTANSGDIDITGFRRPVSYWREIVWGLRDEPYLAVRPPEHHGEPSTVRSRWAFTDAVASWSWPGFEGRPVTVEVYAAAEEVELLVNGESIGRAKVGEDHPFVATFETTFESGTLVAIARRDGDEVARTALVSCEGPVQLAVSTDCDRTGVDSGALVFVDIECVDAAGTVQTCDERDVTVTVDGPAVLQGLGSGNPCTEDTFATATHRTYRGRALAAVRPTGPGMITVTVSDGAGEPVQVGIEAIDDLGESGDE